MAYLEIIEKERIKLCKDYLYHLNLLKINLAKQKSLKQKQKYNNKIWNNVDFHNYMCNEILQEIKILRLETKIRKYYERTKNEKRTNKSK